MKLAEREHLYINVVAVMPRQDLGSPSDDNKVSQQQV